jgi:urease accessory protein
LEDAALRALVADAGTPVHACGVTSPNAQVVVVRALAAQVEPVLNRFKQVRAAWHEALWGVAATAPRLWRM